MSKLLGKRALVTAGAQGIGLAISRHLLRAGCDVFVHYRSSADAAKALEREAVALGRRCGSASADLAQDPKEFVDATATIVACAKYLVGSRPSPCERDLSGPILGLRRNSAKDGP